MAATRLVTGLFFGLCLGLLLHMPTEARERLTPPQMIHLDPDGPHPFQLEVATGTPIVWVSHLDTRPVVVVSVVFHQGQDVAQATSRVEGFNGFVLQGSYFVGRMEANGGAVALRFLTPGEYTYTLDLSNITGKVVVRRKNTSAQLVR